MIVTVRLFSHVRHLLERDSMELHLAPGSRGCDVEARIRALLPEASRNQPFRLAINHEFVSDTQALLNDGDEVAILPPMQGG